MWKPRQVIPGLLLFLPAFLFAEVKFSEIMYHPADGMPEFIELLNDGSSAVDLSGWTLGRGVLYTFPQGVELEPGERIVVCQSRAAVAAAYAIDEKLLLGDYSGALSNGGERLVLSDAEGRPADDFEYSDVLPFDPGADGDGPSLERVCASAATRDPANWRASPAAGGTPLAPGSSETCPPPLPPALSPVVVNEVHYHPSDQDPSGGSDPDEEFIELYNRTEEPVDLSGWQLAEAVDFFFDGSAGPTQVPANGFLLVAKDPDALSLATGIAREAIAGPYEGKLSNYSDELRLLAPGGAFVDGVRYRQDGVWPARADGLGSSLQRVHPDFSGFLPQNWAVAAGTCAEAPTCVLLENGIEVSWFENPSGTDPGFSGELPWFDPDFNAPANGWATGFLAVGYDTRNPEGQPWVLTQSTAEAGLHSILLRMEFHHDPEENPCLTGVPFLAADWDDGFVAWLNGVEIARGGMLDPPGTVPALDGQYRAEVVTAGGWGKPEPVYKPVWSGTPTSLRPGRNVLAVGNYNSRDDSPDLYFTARLTLGSASTTGDLTPGAPNSVASPAVPPLVASAEHVPAEPRSTDVVKILSRVEGPDVEKVEVVFDPGSGEQRVPMRDDGLEDDPVAGDGVYAAALPPQPHLTLVKYRVEARGSSAAGCPGSFPRDGNPSRTTGYFVADDRPEVNGDVRLFYIFTPGALTDLSCDDGAYRLGTFVDFRGRAYFDVGVKFRGVTACNYPKKPLRVEFNKGDLFDGQTDLDFNAGWNDKGMLREKLSFDFFRDAGVPHCEVHMARVHTNGGAFHGAYFTVEDPSTEYLRRNGWDEDGPLYKCFTAMWDGGTAGYEPRTDSALERLPEVGAFGSQLNGASGQALVSFLDEKLDVEEVIDYQAVQAIITDLDSVTKNWLLYIGPHGREQEGPDRFAIFPWDLDLSWGQMRLTTDIRSHVEHPLLHTQTYPFTDQGFHGIINALLERAPDDHYVKAHYGRIWTLLQEKFHPEVLFPELERYGEATIEAVQMDLERWPRTWGERGTDPLYWRQDLRDWAGRRFDYLSEFLLGDNPTTRGRTFRYVPHPRLKFTEIHYNPFEEEDLEFLEICSLEEAPVDISGWTIPAVGFTFPGGSTAPAGAPLVVARNPVLLAARGRIPPGVPVFGPYAGSLDNGGRELRLRDSGVLGEKTYFPETIDLVRYDDDPPWPGEADGGGRSLEIRDLALDNDFAESWQASVQPGGSAGTLGSAVQAPVVVLSLSPASGMVPLTVSFDASGSYDPEEGGDLTFAWDFGDGVVGAGPTVSRTYRIPGLYSGSVTVTSSTSFAEETFSIEALPASGRFRRGDANDDGTLNISDGIFILGFLFRGSPDPGCRESANSNDDRYVDLTDGIYIFHHLFLGGPAPPPPGPPGDACGPDPVDSVSHMGCDDYSSCGD